MNRRSWAVAIAAAVLCLAFAGPAVAKDPVRPFGGEAFGADVASAPTGVCAGYLQTDTISGQGEFLHLGMATFTMTHCTNLDFATFSGTFELGVMTITAANGDMVFLTEHGTFQAGPLPTPTVSHATSWWTITGGTGRFEGATGSGGGGGLLQLSTGAGTLWFSGTIAY